MLIVKQEFSHLVWLKKNAFPPYKLVILLRIANPTADMKTYSVTARQDTAGVLTSTAKRWRVLES